MSTITNRRSLTRWFAMSVTAALVLSATVLSARQARPAAKPAQANDVEYTKRIIDNTPDKRILTELIDHLPASATVPTPLKMLGYIPGEKGNLTYSADVYKYLDALDAASPRVTCWSIGKTEEGRDTRSCAVADEVTIRTLDKYKKIAAQLTDPRKLTEAQAKELIATGKPIYWATGSIHSGETGSVEMLMELGYRLAVEESPFIQTIRNNIITVFTPTTEVDGHDRQVDNQRAARATPAVPSPTMVYWGKYVAHDNNRDGIGKGLALTQNVLKSFLDLHPQVLHDLHESVNLLYVSTGTGPYNAIVDPIQVSEWWLLAQHEIIEMTKRGVPGVWTYNYYDGWVPNYMFWIGVSHNAIGRFYETQSGGNTGANGNNIATIGANSREWYRPNPSPGDMKWNSRANVNMQQSALLLTLNNVAKNKETFLENYYLKMKHSIERGKTQAPYAYVIPAGQRGKGAVAKLVNLIRDEGADVSVATGAFKAGAVDVAAGDYVVRMDQPYQGIVEMYLGLQWYPANNPRPYDDTGWSIPLLHNVKVNRVDDKMILDQAMTTLGADAKVMGTITGTGRLVVVDHTTDTSLATFRFGLPNVKMAAAEQAFEAGGHKFAAGAFVISDRAAVEAAIRDNGLQAWAMDALPANVTTHDLDVPRVGYIHSWQNTQEEGWVRMGLDKLKVPYTYFGDNEVRKGNLRARFDVILYPGATVQMTSSGMPTTGTPQPYKKSAVTPNVGTPDQTDDMRGGLGTDGYFELQKFVNEGGVLITEGQTTQSFVNANFIPGVTVAAGDGTYVPGSVMKTIVGDKSNPILYGYDQNALAVLIKNGPALQVGGGGAAFGGGGRGGGLPEGVGGGELQPMSAPPQLTTLDGTPAPVPMGATAPRGGGAGPGGFAGGGGGRGAGGGGRGGGAAAPAGGGTGPRVLLSYPTDAKDLLLSGELVGGENLVGKAVLIDAPVGKGHAVFFANRPFWRNEPHGNYMLWFNAMLNWNDLK